MAKLIFILFFFSTTSGLCQNEVVLSLPEVSPIYSGYDNAVEISFRKRKIKHISVECDYCDSIRPHPKISTQWVIKAGDSARLTLTVRKKNGKVIGIQKFNVINPPTPTMYLDTTSAQGTVTILPGSLNVKYQAHIPLHTVFVTRNWEIRIGEKTFKGAGSQITKEVHTFLKTEKEGVMIIAATFLGPRGPFELKELFEFVIE